MDAEYEKMVSEARQVARGRWRDILQSAGMHESFLHAKEGPCPMCGGNTRFSFNDKNGEGTFFCRYCGQGDGFKLLGLYLNKTFGQAAFWVAKWGGGLTMEQRQSAPAIPVNSSAMTPEKIAYNKAKHKKHWEEAQPVVEGDPVWRYLHNRIPGFNGALIPKSIRCHPALPYFVKDEEATLKKGRDVYVEVGRHPAMLSFITAPDGSCQDLHRTWLTSDGRKAPYDNVKKTLASIGVVGGAVRLVKPTGNVLGVAEGIETAYAALLFRDIPTWSLANTSGLKNFVIPEWVEYLHIFADNDAPKGPKKIRPGYDAAHCLEKKAKEFGIKVKLHSPAKTGTDMLDLLLNIQQQQAA